MSRAKKIILLPDLSPFDLISGFEGHDSSDSYDKGEVGLVIGQPFVLICQWQTWSLLQ